MNWITSKCNMHCRTPVLHLFFFRPRRDMYVECCRTSEHNEWTIFKLNPQIEK